MPRIPVMRTQFLAYILGVLCVLTVLNISAQANNNRLFYEYGKIAQDDGNHYEACSYFVNAAKVDPNNLEVNYFYAKSLKEINEYRMAEYYFQRAFDLDKEGKYPEAMIGLALVQKCNGKYKESLGNWEIILEYAQFIGDDELEKRAEVEIATCQDILAYNYPYYNNIIRNFSEINTEGAEFSGGYWDTNLVYFSSIEGLKAVPTREERNTPFFAQIVQAEKYNGKWMYGRKMPGSINVGGTNNVDFTINPTRNKYFFVRCEDNDNCDIYAGKLTGSFPEKPAPIAEINASGGRNTMPTAGIVHEKAVLVFASDREGGYGGMDLWYAFITGNNSTEEPINCGPNINTPGDEVSPFIDSRDNALYFSSNWHPGFGGFDVFRSTIDSMSVLSEPINIGYPFNSSANDTYFTLSPERTRGLVTSNRVGAVTSMSETCCNDLYEFTFPPEAGVHPKKQEMEKEEGLPEEVINQYAKVSKMLPITLYFHNDEPNPKSKTTKTQLSYRDCYLSYLGKRGDYQRENAGDEQQIYGSLVEPGYKQLDAFLKELYAVAASGLEIELEIKGYASPLAKDNYNTNLTQRRISSFINQMLGVREGAFKPFVQTAANPTGNLKILLTPLGESKANQGISDDPTKVAQSVYSLAAAKERRIEIARLNLPIIGGSIRGNSQVYGSGKLNAEEDTSAPVKEEEEVAVEEKESTEPVEAPQSSGVPEGVFDLGNAVEGSIATGTYFYKNTSDRTMQFYKAGAECGCTQVKLSKTVLKPGETTEVLITFDAKGKSGVNTKSVYLYEQDNPTPIEIKFQIEVL